MSKEYKPILVIYYPEDTTKDEIGNLHEHLLPNIKKETGYLILLMPTSGDYRAEIISVDKATVVEDIKKYIDEKSDK